MKIFQITLTFLYLICFNNNVLTQSYYPEKIFLDGNWKFGIDSADEYSIDNLDKFTEWRSVKVPLSWQAQFPDLRDYQGIAWYKKDFSVRQLKPGERILIRFNAVDYKSEIYLNGTFIGFNEGGYTPFDFDISKFIKPGKNTIAARVLDPKTSDEGIEDIKYKNIPHGKQSWYVQTSGIWQSVFLEIEQKKFIREIHITPLVDGSFKVEGKFNNSLSNNAKQKLNLKVIDQYNKTVYNTSAEIFNKDTLFEISGTIQSPKLWDFEFPNLYTLQLIFNDKSKYEVQFGFRSIETSNKKLFLNGRPFYLIGALDQDFYPETIYTTPSEEYIRDEMLKAKKLGLNTLRCHIKVPDPIYLKVADEVGLLVWYEIPNWDELNKEAKIRSRKTLERMLQRDWNHPSLAIISLINESWGIDLQKPDQREWLKSEFDFAKQLARGRLIVDNSACYGNFNIKTDINDYHIYWSIPENYKNFSKTIDEINNRPDWLFSKFGDSEQSGEEPLIISEFGNWGLPKLSANQPWWFSKKFFDIEPSLPAEVNKRFKEFSLDKIFKTYNQLAEETQAAQFRALKYEIEQIRLSSQIQGYVITEFTDINWEANGLLDMWRNPKVYANYLSNIQQQDIIIPRPEKYNFFSGDTAKIKIFFSHYSNSLLKDAVLFWKSSAGNSGEVKLNEIIQTELIQLSDISIPLNNITQLEKVKIEFEIQSGKKIIAKNYSEVFLYPKIKKSSFPSIELSNANEFQSIKKYLDMNKLNSDEQTSKVIITNTIAEDLFKRIKSGENVLCLVDSTTKFPDLFSLKLIDRKKDLYEGNWISNFNWLKTDSQPFNKFNFGNFSGFEAVDCEPKIAIGGILPENFEHVLAGMFIGWIHLNSGFILEDKIEKGILLLCTFPIETSISYDPFTQTLLQKLIEYLE